MTDTAQAALDRIERKAELLRLEAKQRNHPNMAQHMEEIAKLVKMVRRRIPEHKHDD